MSRVDALWARMLALYGHAWASQYGTAPEGIAAETWAIALNGLSADDLGRGLRACVAEGAEFPPSAPRFRGMCAGIPSLGAVRRELHPRFDGARTPFATLVWAQLDSYRFKQASADQADRLLREAYELAREEVMRGEPLPEAVEVIGQDKPAKPKPANPEVAAAAQAEIRDLLRIPDAEAELEAHYAGLAKPIDPAATATPARDDAEVES